MDPDWDGEVVHEGWLTKSPPLETKAKHLFSQTLIQPRWRRRWFQLRSGAMPGQFVLQYYVDSTAKKLKGSIDLDQCEQVDSGLTFSEGKVSFQYMFDIKTPRRDFYLAADTEEEMSQWVEMVCRVCGMQNYGQEPVTSPDHGQAIPPPVTAQPQAISGPYMHLSECFTGGQPTTSARKPSSMNGSTGGSTSTCMTTVPLNASIIGEESFTVGDDSVFLPSSPAAAAVTGQLSQLGLGPAAGPGRPPKPPGLRNLSLSYPSQHSANDNYENHDLASHLTTKVETNNNCDSGTNDGDHTFLPPTVDRRLKPERLHSPTSTVTSAMTLPMQGPPVQRSRKPSRIMTDTSSTYPGHQYGMSIPGEDGSGGSEAGSMIGSSDEQIYFYMPSIQTNDGMAPIMIPASELRDNAVQYLDLDFPATDSSLVDTSFNTSMDRSQSRIKYGGGETVYKSVDFVKTEAFNRTRQKVEQYKYKMKQED